MLVVTVLSRQISGNGVSVTTLLVMRLQACSTTVAQRIPPNIFIDTVLCREFQHSSFIYAVLHTSYWFGWEWTGHTTMAVRPSNSACAVRGGTKLIAYASQINSACAVRGGIKLTIFASQIVHALAVLGVAPSKRCK